MTVQRKQRRPPEELVEAPLEPDGIESTSLRIPIFCATGGTLAERIYLCDRPSMALGRSDACDIQLEDETVAPFHARLHQLYEVVVVEDLGSTTGTFVNGSPISGRIQLREGDVVGLGAITLRFGWRALALPPRVAPTNGDAPKAGAPVEAARQQMKKRQERSIWKQMGKQLNFGLMKPQGINEVLVRSFVSVRGEPYYVLKNQRDYTYLRLDPQQYILWTLMDGTRTVQELTIEYFTRFNSLSFAKVIGLIEQLYSHGFFTERPVRVYERLGAKLKRTHLSAIVDRLIHGFFDTRFPLRNLDARLGWLYRWIARPFYTRAANWVYPVIVAIGATLLLLPLLQGGSIVESTTSFTAGIVVLIVAYILAVSAHEFAHALTVKHFGGEVREGGMMVYFGGPAFFANTTDIWLAPRRARFLVSWAGPYSGLIIASTLVLVATLLGPQPLASVLRQAALMFYIGSLVNLNPLLELDGYYLLMDFLEIPLLRRKALAFLTQGRLFSKLRKREPFNKEERIFLWFGLMAFVWSAAAIIAVVSFWLTHLSQFIGSLWSQPDVWSKVVAATLFVLLALVVLIIPLSLVFRVAMKLRLQWRLVRRQLMSRHYREDLLMLSRLPFLAGVPPIRLLMVARRLRPRSYVGGSFIINQGDQGDRFYLIRSGTVEVLEDQGVNAVPKKLRELGPGDYFGEIALIRHVPRTASVRALTHVTALVLDREVFEQLLRPHFTLYERSKQVVEEQEAISSIPLFAALKPKERDLLASKLIKRHFAQGDVVIEQGSMGEHFYVIKSGHVGVSIVDADGQDHAIRTLGPGQYFGEIALLLSAPRTASVRALDDVDVWMLHRTDFTDLLTSYLSVDAGALAMLSGVSNISVDLMPLQQRSMLR